MPHVTKNQSGDITGVYSRPQQHLGTIAVPEDDAHYLAYALSTTKASAKLRIDVEAGSTRRKFASPGEFLQAEYELAKEEAEILLEPGYEGDVPSSVQSWADASGLTPEAAAQNILDTAEDFKNILNGIRAIRLTAKANVDAAESKADIDTIMTDAFAALSQIGA